MQEKQQKTETVGFIKNSRFVSSFNDMFADIDIFFQFTQNVATKFQPFTMPEIKIFNSKFYEEKKNLSR